MKKSHKANVIVALVGLQLLPVAALAQTPPDAGALQQQIDRERQQQLPKRIAPEKPATPAAMSPAAGVVVTVRQFRFAGNTLLSNEQLAPVVAEFLNRPLDFNQLQAAAAAIADTYRTAGWVVRAYLPQQDIKDGQVTIQIVEAVFGAVRLEGAPSTRLSIATVRAMFDARQQSGKPLNADILDRALLLADDLPGVTVAGTLQAGRDERETDLALKLGDEALLIGEAALDNTGSRSTGSERLTANLNLISPMSLGDLLTSNLIHTQGSDYLRAGYTLPVGSDGWRAGANLSHMRYDLISAEYKGKDGHGTSNSAGLEASYPLIRSRLKNIYLTANADHKRFDNAFLGNPTTRYSVNSLSAGLNGNLFDNLAGGGANSASVALVSGQRKADIGTTDQTYTKLRYSLSRQQVITNDLSFFAALAGQYAAKNLDTSEQFYLGGASGARAYPTSEAGGASGKLANLELRWKLPEGLVLTGFYDHGQVSNHEGGKSYSLKGAGIALAWQANVGLSLKATLARRIGDNPNPAADGINDQDGSLDMNRVWLTASMPF